MSVKKISILVKISASTLMAAFHVAVMKDSCSTVMDRIALVKIIMFSLRMSII